MILWKFDSLSKSERALFDFERESSHILPRYLHWENKMYKEMKSNGAPLPLPQQLHG